MKLAVILSNPPTTSGERTLKRVDLAGRILKSTQVRVANLFPVPTYRNGAISEAGVDPQKWFDARAPMLSAIEESSMVLLAYGVQAPKGKARINFHEQVNWLINEISIREIPIIQFGDRPMHPSRWQRHTSRYHPTLNFEEAARIVLLQTGGPVTPTHG